VPDEVRFQTKQQIALDLILRALDHGIRVKAWTFDEFYGRDGRFLDGLDERGEAFVGEVPPDCRVWLNPPRVLRNPPAGRRKTPKRYPRLQAGRRSSQVQHLRRHSSAFHDQRPQRYRIKDTCHGPDIWEIQWHTCWRRAHGERLISRQHTLLVARNVVTDEIKYFLSNRVPGRRGWSLRDLLRVAFGRWNVENCFREAKEELGLDHFECRGWKCVHRHLYCTILSQLFCARVRQQFATSDDVTSGQLLTVEQVRRATTAYLQAIGLPPRLRTERYKKAVEDQRYHQERNAQAAKSHRKTHLARLLNLGIDPETIKSCLPKDRSS